jgi:iron complex outermembrane receptor protein
MFSGVEQDRINIISKHIRGNFLYVFCFVLLLTGTATAKDFGIVEGHISSKENGKPLASASIYLKSDKTIGTLAGKNGYFKLKLKPGKYTLIISFTGMLGQEIPVEIEAGKNVILNVELLPYAAQFDPITISASRFERTPEELLVSTDIVKPEFFKEKNITTIDKALDFVPGMIILDEEPQIRGGSGFTFGVGSKVNVMLDNIPLITGDAGKPDWNLVPIENLKQVEVIKGPGSVLSGANAMSGAVYL